MYNTMEEALEDCCDNVWAVIEVSPPYADSLSAAESSYRSSSDENQDEVDGDDGYNYAASSKETGGSVIGTHRNCSGYIMQHIYENIRKYTDAAATAGTGDGIGSGSGGDSDSAQNSSAYGGGSSTLEDLWASVWSDTVLPSLNIRMHPGSVPDTRNFE